jgi:hypothetical protein
MKTKKRLSLILLILTFCFSSSASGIDLGAFFITHEAKLYLKPDMKGRHLLTRLKKAYEVTEVQEYKGKIIFQIIYPGRKIKEESNGFINYFTLLEKENSSEPVKVYTSIPETKEALLDYKLIPFKDLQALNQRQPSKVFPETEWVPVSFNTLSPTHFWVYADQGIYRPEKNIAWLQNTYSQLNRLKYKSDMQEKLMKGIVDVGFSKLDVRLGLGAPLNTVKLEKSDEQEWIYPHLKVAFKKDTVVKVQ